ncbi:hypothetical protein HYPSUDRAFT_206711 [Hypholoma sublateritium FD-334 SS-4]|uniref:Uncharacterized protein n=1 Tax=Hypholoma sublateritium (strain FD-334 SS-4) TaxID=945553 RepID=A0A0D2NCJ0_HYPSF|nr:hypothetical protein HYPSUDRAFT_206711 [Hypholoma sublateritium FD-334 SS-4]
MTKQIASIVPPPAFDDAEPSDIGDRHVVRSRRRAAGVGDEVAAPAKEKAVELMQKMLQLDVGNALYWAALGDAYFVAHTLAWVNLGLLYAYHGDVDLANEALYRAQILWTLGRDNAHEGAKTYLLDCIAAVRDNLPAITALAGMSILTADNGLVDAALSELQKRLRHTPYLSTVLFD